MGGVKVIIEKFLYLQANIPEKEQSLKNIYCMKHFTTYLLPCLPFALMSGGSEKAQEWNCYITNGTTEAHHSVGAPPICMPKSREAA